MSMRVRIAGVAFAFTMMPAAVGCSIGGMVPHPPNPSRPTSAAAATTQAPLDTTLPGRWTADYLAQAFTAINQKVGANPADYVDVSLSGYSLLVKAINPQKRQNVDEYTYDGTGVKVAPVDVSSSEPGAVEESAFKSDTLKPDVLAKVMGSAVNDSGLDGVHVASVSVEKFFANDSAPVIQVSVEGPRGHKAVRYEMNGQFKEVV